MQVAATSASFPVALFYVICNVLDSRVRGEFFNSFKEWFKALLVTGA